MKLDEIKATLRKHIDATKHRLLHPEEYDPVTGMKFFSKRQRSREPLAPRYRLTARLTLLTILKEYENELMKEILADAEAVGDAKAAKP